MLRVGGRGPGRTELMGPEQQRLGFRDDINALRALAVALVLLFHFRLPGFVSGFVGVDVFFVVSGYLMTAIIASQPPGSFSLVDFYLARARRIVPALVALVAGLFVFGWFWLTAYDFETLGSESLYALLFVSNHYFANEVGYFATEAHEKWLLHTWSLSVEWQFYLAYPILIHVMRVARISMPSALSGLLIGSFTIAWVMGRSNPDDAFFLLLPRAWELLAGGLVFALDARVAKLRRLPLASIGVVLILLAALLPGAPAWPMPVIPAVAGAVLILIARRERNVVTSSGAVRAIGRWSYSIYLWHWPLFVAAIYLGMPTSAGMAVALLALSVILGGLSHRFVETPFRRKRDRQGLPLEALAAAWAVSVGLATALVLTNGAVERHPEVLARIEREAFGDIRAERCGWDKDDQKLVSCPVGLSGNPPAVAVWGDSHAKALQAAVSAALAARNEAGALFYRNGCRPLQGLLSDKGGTQKDCVLYNRVVLEQVSASPSIKTVLLLANWSYDIGAGKLPADQIRTHFGDGPLQTPEARYAQYAEHMVGDLCALRRMGKRVIVVTPVPYFGTDVPRSMAKTYLQTGQLVVPSLQRQVHLARNETILRAFSGARSSCGVEVLDLSPVYCDGETCYGARDGQPLLFDDNHPSSFANSLIAPLVGRALSAGTSSSPAADAAQNDNAGIPPLP
jgi:peptidoglycan/LPS O-acetylase OafA/YrhL